MPFQPAANPDLAAHYAYQGLATFGAGIAGGLREGLGGFLEKQEQKKKDRKTYLGLIDSMLNEGELNEVEAAKLHNADTDTMMGYVKGKQFASTLKQLRTQNALSQQQIQLSQQQIDALNYKLGEEQRMGRAEARFGQELYKRVTPTPQFLPPEIASQAPMPRAPIQPEEIYGMAAKAGLPITGKGVGDVAESFQRYGVPGTITVAEGPGGVKVAGYWNTKSSVTPIPANLLPDKPAQPTQVKPTQYQDFVEYIDSEGKSHLYRRDPEAGLGKIGQMNLDILKGRLAGLESFIINVQGDIAQKGGAAFVPEIDEKGNRTGKQITLQQQLEKLLKAKSQIQLQIQSLYRSTPEAGYGGGPDATSAGARAGGGAVPVSGTETEWDRYQRWLKTQPQQ